MGAVADRVARKLTIDGVGKMYCTAGLGGKVSGILKTTEAADCIVALDGCSLNCAKLSLENAGFTDYIHIRVTDQGMEKGSTEVSDENIATVAEAVALRIHCS